MYNVIIVSWVYVADVLQNRTDPYVLKCDAHYRVQLSEVMPCRLMLIPLSDVLHGCQAQPVSVVIQGKFGIKRSSRIQLFPE